MESFNENWRACIVSVYQANLKISNAAWPTIDSANIGNHFTDQQFAHCSYYTLSLTKLDSCSKRKRYKNNQLQWKCSDCISIKSDWIKSRKAWLQSSRMAQKWTADQILLHSKHENLTMSRLGELCSHQNAVYFWNGRKRRYCRSDNFRTFSSLCISHHF